MTPDRMTPGEAHRIYDLLIEICDAPRSYLARQDFMFAMTDPRPPREYRFCGSLGFGGKLWIGRDKWYVTCYPEDTTAERDQTVIKANEALARLRAEIVT
jgi:hypothetical protein